MFERIVLYGLDGALPDSMEEEISCSSKSWKSELAKVFGTVDCIAGVSTFVWVV